MITKIVPKDFMFPARKMFCTMVYIDPAIPKALKLPLIDLPGELL